MSITGTLYLSTRLLQPSLGVKHKQAMNHSFNKDLQNQILYEIITLNSKKVDNLYEKLLDYILLAKTVSGFEHGFISYIEGERYSILQADLKNKPLGLDTSLRLQDTLCQEVLHQGTTLIHGHLEGTIFYNLPIRTFLEAEAAIAAPIFINKKVVGVLTICSISEKQDVEPLNFYAHILELIAGQLSQLLRENTILEKLEEDRLLLHMGAELLKMGTYKRYLHTKQIECTASIHAIFDLHPSDSISFEKVIPKIVEADKALLINNFSRYNPVSIPYMEYRLISSDGTIKWIRHQTKYDKNKNYVLGIVQDITILKNSLLELDRRNKELEQFAYATAHDLQEPLRTIQGFSELLIGNYQEQIDEDGQLYLSFLKDSAERMQKQIEGLLHHSRIGRTGQKITIDLDQLVQTIIDDFRFTILDQNAQVVLLQPLPSIVGYATEIRMLFQNLISNALKFAQVDRPSIVQISYFDERTHYAFQIKDNGIGMEAAQLDKIFELFVRLHPRDHYVGTGIGLTHCKKIVELHNGEISVASTPRVGTTFTFTLEKM